MDKKYDAIIIGAGVIGSAISFELSKRVLELDANEFNKLIKIV